MRNSDHPRDQEKHSCHAAKSFFTAFSCPSRASAADLRNENLYMLCLKIYIKTSVINESQHTPADSIISPIVDKIGRQPNLCEDVCQMLKSNQYAVS